MHELAVIPRQVVGRPRDTDACPQQSQFELPQRLFATAVGVRDQGAHHHAPVDRCTERLLEFGPVEAEDGDVDGLLRFADDLHDRCETVFRLDYQFHVSVCLSLLLLFGPVNGPMPLRIQLEDRVRDRIGRLGFERNRDVVTDLFVR